MADKKVLVLGGTGFVGESIVKELINKGYRPVIVARDNSRVTTDIKEKCEVILGDMKNFQNWKGELRDIDSVIYLIGLIKETKTAKFEDAHYLWAKELMDWTKENKVKKFIYMSANGVKQAGTKYQTTKWRAEQYLKSLGISYTIIRPSIIWDESSKYNFKKVIEQLIKFRIVPVFGSGNYKMAPVSREKVAKTISESVEEGKNKNEIVKLVGDKVFTYKELVKSVAKDKNTKILIAPIPMLLVLPAVKIIEKFPFSPVTSDQVKMLVEGNN